jgi:hypothetical protein
MKGILEVIKLIYGSKALSKILGTRTNVIRLPDNELKQYTKSDLNIEAASDKLAQKAKADMKELLADYPRMNDAEKLIFEGNLRRLGNKLGVTEKGPAADVLEFGTGEKVSPEGIMSLTEKAGQKNPPTTLMGNLESRIKQLEASGEDLSKIKGQTYDEFMNDITQGQRTMIKLEDEGLVRATAREIIDKDIKSKKIKLPKEIEADFKQGGGEPIDVFRQFYGEDALEQLNSMVPDFKQMYSSKEAAEAATKKFKFEFKADRPPGSISIEDAKKAEQEFGINKPKQNEATEVTDITAKVYRNADPDELIGEYNKNLDLLSQVDEEGGTLIGYEQFKKLQNRNTEIEKILNSIGIKSADSPEGKKITEALIGKPKASVTELVTAEKIISDMKKMDPMDAMKEANKVLKKEGKYKNLQEKDVERIMEDTNDFIFGRDIPEDPEGFAKGGAASKGLDYLAGVERREYAEGSPNYEVRDRYLQYLRNLESAQNPTSANLLYQSAPNILYRGGDSSTNSDTVSNTTAGKSMSNISLADVAQAIGFAMNPALGIANMVATEAFGKSPMSMAMNALGFGDSSSTGTANATDTGDMGSEAANNAATDAANASVGAGDGSSSDGGSTGSCGSFKNGGYITGASVRPNLNIGGRVRMAGGGISQGLDYLMGIERRGYQEGGENMVSPDDAMLSYDQAVEKSRQERINKNALANQKFNDYLKEKTGYGNIEDYYQDPERLAYDPRAAEGDITKAIYDAINLQGYNPYGYDDNNPFQFAFDKDPNFFYTQEYDGEGRLIKRTPFSSEEKQKQIKNNLENALYDQSLYGFSYSRPDATIEGSKFFLDQLKNLQKRDPDFEKVIKEGKYIDALENKLRNLYDPGEYQKLQETLDPGYSKYTSDDRKINKAFDTSDVLANYGYKDGQLQRIDSSIYGYLSEGERNIIERSQSLPTYLTGYAQQLIQDARNRKQADQDRREQMLSQADQYASKQMVSPDDAMNQYDISNQMNEGQITSFDSIGNRLENIVNNPAIKGFTNFVTGSGNPFQDISQFTPSQQSVINQAIENAAKEGRTNITYADYPKTGVAQLADDGFSPMEYVKTLGSSIIGNPVDQIKTTLGQFAYDPQQQQIKDFYDFQKQSGNNLGTSYPININVSNPKEKLQQLPYMDQYQKDYQTRISQVDPNALRNRYLENLQNTSSQDINQFQSQLRSNLVPRENQPQGLDYLTGL